MIGVFGVDVRGGLRTYNNGISNVLLDVFDLLLLFPLAEAVDVQNPHLLDDRRLPGLAGAEQKESVRGPVDLLLLGQLPVDVVVDPLLAPDVLGGRGGIPVAEAAHGRQRGPPAISPLVGGHGAALWTRRHRGCPRARLLTPSASDHRVRAAPRSWHRRPQVTSGGPSHARAAS